MNSNNIKIQLDPMLQLLDRIATSLEKLAATTEEDLRIKTSWVKVGK